MTPVFNEDQQKFIDAPIDQKVIGVASAGAGKTTVILARAKRILQEYPTGKVLLITFTRNSAKDMRDRLVKQVSENDLRRTTVGTFHAVLAKIIRDNAVAVGLQPSFSIIDENSTSTMYRSIIETSPEYLTIMENWFVTPNHPKLMKTDYSKAARAVSALVNTSAPEELMTGVFSDDTKYRMCKVDDGINKTTVEPILTMLHSVFKESLNQGRKTNTVNYDHILFIGYLMCKSGLMKPFKDSLAYMIVDEYQDTNLLQDAFVRYAGNTKLSLVGDVDQSIYGFRGGRPHLLEDHAKEGLVFNLRINYRSYTPILDLANNVIQHNTSGASIRKPMIGHKQNDESFGGVLHIETKKDFGEADFVLDKINFLLSKGVKHSEIAILVRSRMAVPAINDRLVRSKLPVNDTTKFADFMNSDVMVDTLNFIKIFTNPRDIYAFMAVLDRPKRGLGPKALETLINNAEELDLSIIEYIMSPAVDDLPKGLKSKVQVFIDVYSKIINPDNTMNFPETVQFLLKETGYIDWINGLKNNETHLNNLDILKGFIDEFTEEYAKEHAQYSLYDIANAFTFEMLSSTKNENEDGICVATIHGSKGLEWEHVFVLGMEDEIFPGGRLFDNEDMESERRLMYVAITRAKNSLTLCQTHSRISFGEKPLHPSVFLKECGIDNKRIV